MSALKDFYVSIRGKILADVPEVRTVKLFNNQLDNEQQEEAFAYPAVFIEFSSIDWATKLNAQKNSLITITVHIAQESYETDDIMYFDLVNGVYIALEGHEETFFTGLSRITDRQDVDHDNCIVWQIDFQAELIDCSADPRLVQVTTPFTPTISINADLDIDDPVIRTGDGDI